MYIYLQYHGKYTKDIGTTVYILDSFFLFKTFDSCIYITEVSFHWFFKLRSLSHWMLERAMGQVLSTSSHRSQRRKTLAVTYTPN